MERYKLGDICEIVSGSTPKTSIEEYWDGDVKWITPAELDDDSYIITDTVRKITDLAVKKTGLSSFPEGTVILSSRAPIGKVAIAGCEMYCNQGFKNLICTEKIYNRYLYWFLKGNTEFLNTLGRGATFKEISKQIVANIEINVPAYDKQLEIVAHLEKVSEIIKLRKQEIQKLDEFIKARFDELFGTSTPNDIDSEDYVSVANVCSSMMIGPFGSALHKPEMSTTGEVFVLGTDNAVKNEFAVKEERFISSEKYSELTKYTVKGGDVIITMMGTIGRVAVIPDGFHKAIISSHLSCLTPDVNIIYPRFLHAVLTLDDGISLQIAQQKKGAIMSGLNLGIIKNLRFKMVDKEKQKVFLDFVEQTDKSKFIYTQLIKQRIKPL